MTTWQLQEPGWYTSTLGGICHESNGWWFYPAESMKRFGPFKSKKKAIEKAEAHER